MNIIKEASLATESYNACTQAALAQTMISQAGAFRGTQAFDENFNINNVGGCIRPLPSCSLVSGQGDAPGPSPIKRLAGYTIIANCKVVRVTKKG